MNCGNSKAKLSLAAAAVLSLALFTGAVICKAGSSDTALSEVLAWLEKNPDVIPGDASRNVMLKKLDPVFLEETAILNPAVGKYFKARMRSFTEDLDASTPATGSVLVWKLYNMGAVVKSRDGIIALDLISGRDKVKWNPDDLNRVISICDALVITHGHLDHADMTVARKFLAAGKKVVTPPGVWEKSPGMGAITTIRDGSLDIKGIRLTSFPGFQSEYPDNVYLLEFSNGIKILDTGDENGASLADGKGWLAAVTHPIPVDVVMFNSWSPVIQELLEQFPARLLIPAHEHELTHGTSRRSSYTAMIEKASSLGIPYVLMAWGEKIEVHR